MVVVNGKLQLLARVVAHIYHGLDLNDLALRACHHCDNPQCFRPSHLFVGTQLDNIYDYLNKGTSCGGYPGGSQQRHQEILRLHAEGYSQRKIGSIVGLTYVRVGQVIRKYKESI